MARIKPELPEAHHKTLRSLQNKELSQIREEAPQNSQKKQKWMKRHIWGQFTKEIQLTNKHKKLSLNNF